MQKKESSDVGEITKLNVWVKSRTKKDGTAVNMDAAEKIVIRCFFTLPAYQFYNRVKLHKHNFNMFKEKANEFIRSDDPGASSSNPKEDTLSQILGPDNPGRLRAMGRGMSVSKLAFFEVKSKYVTEMQQTQIQLKQQVHELQEALAKMNSRVSAEDELSFGS